MLLVSDNSSTFELDPATGQIGRQIADGDDGVVSPNRTRVAYVRVTDPCPTATTREETTTSTAPEETTTTVPEESTTTSTAPEETTTTVPEESTTTSTAPGETTTTVPEESTTTSTVEVTTTTVPGETTTTIPGLPPCFVAAADLLTADITGADERTIVTSEEPLARFSPDWAPDSSRILFSWSEAPAGGALSWVRPDGSGQETLVPGAKHGTFSPDGKEIAYVDRSTGDLHVINVTTRRTRALTTGGTDGNGGPPDWSPDGRQITYATQQGVLVLDARTGEAVNLAQGWTAPVGGFETAVYSPSGNEIAFAALDSSAGPEGEAVRRVYVVSASGGEPRTVAAQNGHLTDWLRL